MKGIEGLPLKYIVLIIVAAIVIGVVVSITNMFSKGAGEGAEKTLGTMSEATNQASMNACLESGAKWSNTTSTCCMETFYNSTHCCEETVTSGVSCPGEKLKK